MRRASLPKLLTLQVREATSWMAMVLVATLGIGVSRYVEMWGKGKAKGKAYEGTKILEFVIVKLNLSRPKIRMIWHIFFPFAFFVPLTQESIYGVSFADEFEHGVGDALSMKLDWVCKVQSPQFWQIWASKTTTWHKMTCKISDVSRLLHLVYDLSRLQAYQITARWKLPGCFEGASLGLQSTLVSKLQV